MPFETPLRLSSGIISARQGLYIAYSPDKEYIRLLKNNAEIGQNSVIYGEAAPLPGFSNESLDEVEQWLKVNNSALNHWLNNEYSLLSDGYFDKTSVFDSICPILPDLPSLHFAVDSIRLQLYLSFLKATGEMEKHPQYLRFFGNTAVSVNITVNSLEQISGFYNKGFRVFKIKVGIDTDSEIALLSNIRKNFSDVILRLDANAAWKVSEAESILPEFSPFEIEYIEQPVSVADLLLSGSDLKGFGIPIAADESARNISDIIELLDNNSCDVVILKPMLLGSLYNLTKILKLCSMRTVKVIVTTSLESGLGRRMTALLTSRLLPESAAHGLATAWFLKPDRFDDRHLIESGEYAHPGILFSPDENY